MPSTPRRKLMTDFATALYAARRAAPPIDPADAEQVAAFFFSSIQSGRAESARLAIQYLNAWTAVDCRAKPRIRAA